MARPGGSRCGLAAVGQGWCARPDRNLTGCFRLRGAGWSRTRAETKNTRGGWVTLGPTHANDMASKR